MGLQGIDISEYQGDVDFKKVHVSGNGGFVYAKASEGLSVVDEKFNAYHDAAKAEGVVFGAYHFFHFSDNPIVQANLFLNTISGREGLLLPMVDVEILDTHSPILSERVKVLGAFLDVVEETLKGKKAIIYTGLSFWNEDMGGSDAFQGHPLWIAEYNNGSSPELPSGFKDWVLWQHTSGGCVDGISGSVDLDVLNGYNLDVIQR